MSDANKQHEASYHKLWRMKREGQWYKSRDLPTAAILGVMALAIGNGLPFFCDRATQLAAIVWAPERIASQDPLHVFDQAARQAAFDTALMVGGLMVAVFLVVALTQFLQMGPIFTMKPLWNVKKLNPFTGFKGIFFNPATYQKLAINLVKAALLLSLAYFAVRGALNGMLYSMRLGPIATAKLFHEVFSRFLMQVATITSLFAGAEYMIERHRFLKEARMDDEEAKEDQKDQEGNVEAKMKARFRMLMQMRMGALKRQ